MEHWNAGNSHHMHDRKSDQGFSSPHHEGQTPSDNLANYSHHYFYPVVYPYATSVKGQDQLGAIQYYHPLSTYDSSGAAAYNAYNAGGHNGYILPTSRDFFAPVHNGSTNQFVQSGPMATGVVTSEQFSQNTPAGIDINTNEHSGNYEFTDSHRAAYKRKHPEVVTGDQYLANAPASAYLSSASSRTPQHGDPNENVLNVMAPSAFSSAEYLENVKTPTIGTQHLSESSECNSVDHQQQPESMYTNYIGQAFQPSSFGWAGHYENYSHDGSSYNWNYMNPASNVNARYVHSGAVDSMNTQMQEYSGFTFHPPPLLLSNQHQHSLYHVQNMQVDTQDQNTQAPVAPCYWHPVTSLQTSNSHSFVDDANSANRPRLPPLIAEDFNWSMHEATEEYEDAEDSYDDSDSDQHGDMRMDIEEMSYEELLALEEQIGDVNTGLSEDLILKNLKTSVCAPLALSLLDLSSRLLNERCGICLVEYEEQERIGTLDCGHSYHADCIKEWLLIKNLCPICKSSALASGRTE